MGLGIVSFEPLPISLFYEFVPLFFFFFFFFFRSDTDLGNTQSAPRGGERATVC